LWSKSAFFKPCNFAQILLLQIKLRNLFSVLKHIGFENMLKKTRFLKVPNIFSENSSLIQFFFFREFLWGLANTDLATRATQLSSRTKSWIIWNNLLNNFYNEILNQTSQWNHIEFVRELVQWNPQLNQLCWIHSIASSVN